MEKIWLKSYPNDVAHTIDPDSLSSINEIFETSFKKFRERPAFSNMGTSLTYGQIDQLSQAFAAYLQHELGLVKGDRVAIMSPNILQYPVCLFGILRAGLVVVNVNPLYTSRELEHQLKDSGAKAIVIVENFCHVLESVLSKTQVQHVITTQLGDLLKFPKALIVNLAVKHLKKMVPAWRIPKAVSLKDALAKGQGKTLKPVDIKRSDIAFLQYTGGTTGVSKGAVLTHRNMIANMLQAREWIRTKITEGKEVIITPLPLYHIFSLTANCFIYGSLGAENVLITNPRDIPGFVKELAKVRFTTFTGVNTLFNGLLNHPDFAKLDFSSFRLSLGGGMAVQRPVAERWKKVTGVTLLEAYGLTETAPAACINPLTETEYNGTIGLPVPSTEISIRNDDGEEMPLGEPGEIWIRGPQVMQGYWNQPEETANVLTEDGWFKSGDIGYMDERGYTTIVDRKKDMILVSGFNVYPNEIEEVVVQHDKVLEAAAVGIPDEKSGEVVKIYVVKKDASLTEEEILTHCREHLTGYKVPKAVAFRDELPKTNVGKILRRALKEETKVS
ncbi:MAG: long-chain-fatty-acid--CoA ligase [Candidatus Sericytochromatia bacterium]|nr:long-chain-fatty-acid--CoA ligase [Candidatus Sericytochromatia bacterium]